MRTFLLSITLSFLCIIRGELLTPGDGETLNHIYVLFEWEQVSEAEYYELQIAEDGSFSESLVAIEDNSLVYVEKDIIDWDNTYYWRVRPIYNGGSMGAWIGSFSFNTGLRLSEATTTVIDGDQSQAGLTVFGAFFNYFSAILDQDGKEIWNSGDENFVYYNSNRFGDVFGCNLLSGAENNLPGSEVSFQSGVIWEEPNNEFLHHDMILLPNGNYLGIVETGTLGPIPIGGWTSLFQGLGFQADGVTVEFPWVGDKLVEWDKDSKEVVWSWNIFDYFNMSDYDQFGGTWTEAYQSLQYDWTHVNAVIFDEDESVIYISTRHLSRITKIDYPSGDIVWNLGHQMSSDDVDFGSDIGFSFQHSLQKLDNGNIITFDNGNLAPEFRGLDVPTSRAIEINVDGSNTSLAWSYELPVDLFGFASGNAQRLDNGNVMVTTVGGGGRSLEVDQSGEVVWEAQYNLSLPDGAVYRAHRIPGIFPAAYSVLINNYLESGGDEGVYLPIGTSDISYTIINEGDFPILLNCQISDIQNWFGDQSQLISLEPGSSETLLFSGNISETNTGNLITLATIPEHHAESGKEISVNGFTSPLNTDNNLLTEIFELGTPFPNPFNAKVSINFKLNKLEEVKLQIFNMNGQLIETLLDNTIRSGSHSLVWNAGQNSTGIYFININTPLSSDSRKILFLK